MFLLTMVMAQATWAILHLLLPGAIGAMIALMAGYLLKQWLGRARLDAARNEADRILTESKSEAEVLRKKAEVDAKAEYLKGQERLRHESDEMRAELKEIEKRLAKREDNLEGKLDTLATKERNLEQAHKKLTARTEALAVREQEAVELVAQRREQLLKVGGMTIEEAKRTILDDLGLELDHERAEAIEKSVAAARDECFSGRVKSL